jgi:catechol 2,3-dioxygenase-like lactoylglutathione lyase family enzyme
MLDHIGITVKDLAASKAFYVAALKPLGIKALSEFPGWVGFGKDRPQFWIAQGEHSASAPRAHIAFSTDDRKLVQKFYDAAMAAGAVDNGPPGLRTHYHKNYYGAFVIDPDGYNVEAVSHRPDAAGRSRRAAAGSPAKRSRSAGAASPAKRRSRSAGAAKPSRSAGAAKRSRSAGAAKRSRSAGAASPAKKKVRRK